MITTTYTCDRCKKAVKINELIGVAFGLKFYRAFEQQYTVNPRRPGLSKDLCTTCMVELGLDHPNLNKEAIPIVPPPSLEDIIREFVQQEIAASKDN